MEGQILWIILLTFIPFIELRGSIPYGVLFTDLHWSAVFLIAATANIALGPMIYLFIDKALHIFLRVGFINRLYDKYVVKKQAKIEPYVKRYGHYGLALFIGIPFPGSGSFSGALGSHVLGLHYRQFWVANTLGTLIAASIVMVFTLTGEGAVGYFLALRG